MCASFLLTRCCRLCNKNLLYDGLTNLNGRLVWVSGKVLERWHRNEHIGVNYNFFYYFIYLLLGFCWIIHCVVCSNSWKKVNGFCDKHDGTKWVTASIFNPKWWWAQLRNLAINCLIKVLKKLVFPLRSHLTRTDVAVT